MSIVDYLDTNQVLIGVPSRSKKQVIEELAERVAMLTGPSQRCLMDMIMRRERLGSTGIGGGIAMPGGMGDIGNLPTENIVNMLNRSEIETGLDTELLLATAKEIEGILDIPNRICIPPIYVMVYHKYIHIILTL